MSESLFKTLKGNELGGGKESLLLPQVTDVMISQHASFLPWQWMFISLKTKQHKIFICVLKDCFCVFFNVIFTETFTFTTLHISGCVPAFKMAALVTFQCLAAIVEILLLFLKKVRKSRVCPKTQQDVWVISLKTLMYFKAHVYLRDCCYSLAALAQWNKHSWTTSEVKVTRKKAKNFPGNSSLE